MSLRKVSNAALAGVLNDQRVRRVLDADQTYYVAIDLVAVLAETEHPAEYWIGLKQREPKLASFCERLEVPDERGEVMDVVNLGGALRLVQAVSSPRAEKIKQLLVDSTLERIEEADNPELALVRMTREFEQKGYSRRWISKRLRAMAGRQELTSEWARRGATESEEYRALTNAIMESAFGMDVQKYRQAKALNRPSQNLRDHMTDLELVLTSLGETIAVALHRGHNSQGFEQLQADVRDAGEIVAQTRQEIERRGGRAVVSSRVIRRDLAAGDADAA